MHRAARSRVARREAEPRARRLILFSFSCQFDLAFWAFLAPFAVEVGRWGGHGAVVLLLAMVPRL